MGQGGAVSLSQNATISINNSTLTDNYALNSGSAISAYSSTLNLANSIIANSHQNTDCQLNGATVLSDSNSIIENSYCGTPNPRRIDPELAPLADNGGSTLTHALLDTSLARNSGDQSTCLSKDQRGKFRDKVCDVGAYEFFDDEGSFFVIPLQNGKVVIVDL